MPTGKKTKKSARTPSADDRIQKTLYLPKTINDELRIRAAELNIQQSTIVADALSAYFVKLGKRRAR